MLTHQQRCWDQHRHLFAVLNSLKSCPDSNLGLAIPNIAGQKAIHRDWLFHVPLDLLDGGQLIRSFLEGEGIFEFLLPGGVRAKGVALAFHACRVELDQVNCDFANSFSGVALNSRPVSATHSGKHWRFTADIFGEHIQLIGWNKESIGWIGALGRCVFN